MADCQMLPGCIFFNDKMQNMPSTAGLFKERYCRGNAADCARYIVATRLGREKVPTDIFPNDRIRAERLVKG